MGNLIGIDTGMPMGVRELRRRGRGHLIPGLICVAVGLAIILSMVLPAKFWWFLLGGVLIGLGFYFLRC